MTMILRSMIVGVAVLAIAVVVSAADLKIGYVDSERISNEYKAYAEAQEKVKQVAEDYRQQAMKKQDEISRLMEDYKREELFLSPERKAEMQATLSKKDEEFQSFQEEIFGQSGKIAQKPEELVKPIITRMLTTIQKIAEAEEYDFVFDKGSLPFAKLKYDITEKVLADLNKTTTK